MDVNVAETKDIHNNINNMKSKLLSESLNESSKHNGKLIIGFLLFLSYVFIIALSTTDMQLLVPDSKVNLPIVNVDLPLFSFYIVVPILILVLHFNLLIKLHIHTQKLLAWLTLKENMVNLFPFTFNFPLAVEPKFSTAFKLLSQVTNAVTILIFPLVTLLTILMRFIPYHSYSMTFYHKIILIIDMLLLMGFYIASTCLKKRHSIIKLGCLHIKRKCIIIIFMVIMIIFLALAVNIPKENNSCIAENFTPIFHCNLIVRNKILLASAPSQEIINAFIVKDKSIDKAYYNHAIGLDLSDRDLRFANFSGSNLAKVNLVKAQLQESHLDDTILQDARLSGAQIQNATFTEAQLQHADLVGANLQSTNLMLAKFQGADLSFTDLDGAFLLNTKFEGARLERTKLRGAILEHAQFQGAVFMDSEMQGADLIDANFQGATLHNVNLQGAMLKNVRFQSARLHNTDLSGSDISGSYMNCIHWRYVNTKDISEKSEYIDDKPNTDIASTQISVVSEQDRPLDYSSKINWDDIMNLNEKFLEDKPYLFNYLITKAKNIKCEEEKEHPNFKHDSNSFIAARKRVICTNLSIAKAILEQHKNNMDYEQKPTTKENMEQKKELEEFMEVTCPQILRQVAKDKK